MALKKFASIAPIVQSIAKQTIGIGGCTSLSHGAKKVADLARTFDMPSEVPQNKVGNTTEFDIQHMCRAQQMPILVNRTKKGIHYGIKAPFVIIK